MAFDTATRNELQKMVGRARDLLVKEFTAQCQEIYGIQPDGSMLDAAKLGGETYQRYRLFLELLFDELAVDLGVLFDRYSPHGLLFPRENVLTRKNTSEGLLELINVLALGHVWAEDETIGWVYQYFNSEEERRAMRKASSAPQNSRELAVRNQFFTPRYVVEFLTDNTLGRVWYEMRQGETALKEKCRYLVRRPTEVFLARGEAAPEQADDEGLSQEERLRLPVYVAHRPKKDPRDLKILDPACGSGHFLLYAFDLLEAIYREGWEDPQSPPSEATGRRLHEDYESREDLQKAVPELILRWNLHGIDTDPRAAQIAALSLWLRAQRAWQSRGLKSVDRPQIRKSNIVCAEPMPGEKEVLRDFARQLRPPVLGRLLEVIFDKMRLAGEAGSLLKIEEEIQSAVEDAKQQWLAGPKPEQTDLFPELIGPRQEELRLDFTASPARPSGPRPRSGFWMDCAGMRRRPTGKAGLAAGCLPRTRTRVSRSSISACNATRWC